VGGYSRGSIFRAFVPRAQAKELSVISFSVWQSSSQTSLLVSETNYNKGLAGPGRVGSVCVCHSSFSDVTPSNVNGFLLPSQSW